MCSWFVTGCSVVGSRVFSVLDSGAVGPGFKSQSRRCRVTVLDKLSCLCSSSKIGSTLFRGAGLTAGLTESNGSLQSGLWLTSPAGWLPTTVISFGTQCSVIEYGLPFYLFISIKRDKPGATKILWSDVKIFYMMYKILLAIFQSKTSKNRFIWLLVQIVIEYKVFPNIQTM